MDYLQLLLGLLLPWIGGFSWLRVIESRANPAGAPNSFRQIGYGFFLGYAGLYALVVASAALSHEVQFWPVAGVASCITVIGAFLAYQQRASGAPHGRAGHDCSRLAPLQRAVLVLLLAWIIVHLSLVALEILYRPVYPWDAWLNWMYRAKAWYTQGAIFALSSPTEWATDVSALAYNVNGNHYPTFVPVIALWAAQSLGFWSDTLINVPFLFCGMALVMGIYGQCREMGGNYLHATAAAYLLVSVPMVGTHLALAGMADIWVAGFTGLGFAALLRGLIDDNRFQILLGLFMAALAMGVKVEGLVWLLAAIAMLLLATRPWAVLGIACLSIGLGLVAWMSGVTFVDLAGWGRLGYADGLFHIPFKGGYPLMQFDLSDDYAVNFFLRGSWNLLWSLLLLGLPLLFLPKEKKLWPTLGSFYLVFMATQVVIFGFTEQGRWAEDSTAINRLPMHFLPALILCLIWPVIAIGQRYTAQAGKTNIAGPVAGGFQGRKLLPPLLAVVIMTVGLLGYLLLKLPSDQGKAIVFNPEEMGIVVGGGHVENGIGKVTTYRNNIAIVSSGPISVAADSLSLLRVDTGGENRRAAGFFWRRGSASSDVDSIPVADRGIQIMDLSSSPAWTGQITELGLIFYNDEDRAAEIYELALLPRTLGSSLSTVWNDWTHFERWSQVSSNWIAGGVRNPTISLYLFVLAGLLVLLGVYWFVAGSASRYLSLALACCLTAWIVLDLRWTVNLITQANATIASSPTDDTLSYMNGGEDREVAKFVQSARALMPETATRVLIFAVKPEMRFHMLRAKYHLLPHAAYVHEAGISSIPVKPVDYILRINPIFLEPGAKRPDAAETASLLQAQLGQKTVVIEDNEIGTLFQVGSSDG